MINYSYQQTRGLLREGIKLKALFITAGIFGVWWFADNTPAFLVTPLALIALASIFTGLVIAGVKWVKNV
jgi:hypothetical protein